MLPCVGNAAATIYLALLASPQFINWPMASVLGYSVLYSIFGSYAMVSVYIMCRNKSKYYGCYLSLTDKIMLYTFIGLCTSLPIYFHI